jgi:hypothetical protein
VYIFCGLGLASCRWRQLTSNVRPRKTQLRQRRQPRSTAVNTCRSSVNSPLAIHQPFWAPCEPRRNHSQHSSAKHLERRHVHRGTALPHKKLLLQRSGVGHFRAAQAKQSKFVGPQPGAKRWQSQTVHAVAGNSSTTAPMQVTRKFSPTNCGLRRPVRGHQGTFGTAWPNPLLNLRANGMPQSPRHSAGVHYLWRGLCVTPLSPG